MIPRDYISTEVPLFTKVTSAIKAFLSTIAFTVQPQPSLDTNLFNKDQGIPGRTTRVIILLSKKRFNINRRYFNSTLHLHPLIKITGFKNKHIRIILQSLFSISQFLRRVHTSHLRSHSVNNLYMFVLGCWEVYNTLTSCISYSHWVKRVDRKK